MAKLTYIDHDGALQTIEGLTLTIDKHGRHFIWCDQLDHNLTYETKGLDNALLSAIDSLLFSIQLKDERINKLQKINDLALQFAAAVNPEEEDN